MHHRARAQRQLGGVGLQIAAHPGQAGVVAVADRDDEVGSDEDHDLAGLDDFAGQVHRLVGNVIDRLQDQEQRVVVAFDLGSLVGVHGILDRQCVQAVDLGNCLHLELVGFMQSDPDERLAAFGQQIAGPYQRAGVAELSR